MNDKPKKLVLDYSKWRCGFYSHERECKNQLGIGPVRLLNEQGFSCCLGQFAAQMGIGAKNLMDQSAPMHIGQHLPPFTKPTASTFLLDSDLSMDCMNINDAPNTTPEEKIEALKERLAIEGIELEVINKPENI